MENNSYDSRKYRRRKNRFPAMLLALYIALAAGFGYAGGYVAGHTNVPPAASDSGTPNSSNVQLTNLSVGAASLPDIVAVIKPSVVEITTESVVTLNWGRGFGYGRGGRAGQYITDGAGSGVILSEDGYIATNYHVIEGAQTVEVTLPGGESYPAFIVGASQQHDLAVLKIDARGLQSATLGDSSALRVGDAALAVGNPLGELGGTVTDGIISALDREIELDGTMMTLLQTSAAINPGNSGGGLFNMNGELIGIVNAKSAGSEIEGLGFAIPINSAREVIELIIKAATT